MERTKDKWMIRAVRRPQKEQHVKNSARSDPARAVSLRRSEWPRTVQLPLVRRNDLAQRFNSLLSVCNFRLGDVFSIPICLVSVECDGS